MAPVEPLIPESFHLGELMNLAILNRLLHQVIVSARQRFRLKLYVIGKGLSICSTYLITRVQNLVTRRSEEDQEWQLIMQLGQDYQTLSDESVRSLRQLLEALSSEAARTLARTLFFEERRSLPKAGD